MATSKAARMAVVMIRCNGGGAWDLEPYEALALSSMALREQALLILPIAASFRLTQRKHFLERLCSQLEPVHNVAIMHVQMCLS